MSSPHSISVDHAQNILAARQTQTAAPEAESHSAVRQKLMAAFAACALCVGGSLALHVATCLIGVPAASLVVTGAVNAFSGMAPTVGMVSSPVVAGLAFAVWWRRGGRWSTKPLKLWNVAATLTTALALNPMTPTGLWIDRNVVGLAHAEFWYLTQPKDAQGAIKEIASSLNMWPARYAQVYGLCTRPAPK